MNAHDVVVIGALVDRCPALLALLQEHLDYYETLLPHVFIAEVASWVTEAHGADPDDSDVACALEVLESAFAAGRPDDHELIAASFLEGLPRGQDRGADLMSSLGPTLRGHLARFR